MIFLGRLGVAVSLVLVTLLAFATATLAFDAGGLPGASIGAKKGEGGGGNPTLPAAGNYFFSAVTADFSQCCDPSQPELTIFVSDTINKANPLVGQTVNTHEVDVQIFACDSVSGICGGGCFIPDGANDLTISSDLSSAVLKTTVTDSTAPCQDTPITGLPTSFTVNVTWTSQGSAGPNRMVGRYTCGGYSNEKATTNNSAVSGSAIASTSLLTGTFEPVYANLNSNELVTHAQGTALDSCSPLGGKGAGPGPLSPGDYSFASRSASLVINPDDASQPQISVFVTSFVNTLKPRAGPASTQVETDLNIFQATSPDFVQNCYVIPAGAFAISDDLQSASLHVSIDPTTPACPQASNRGFADTFTLDANWTGTGPVSTFRNIGSSGCPTSHLTMTENQSTISAVATGGLTGIAKSFIGESPSMTTDASTFHVDGRQAGC